MSDDKIRSDFLSINARYQGAWNECNSRRQTKTTILQYYMVAATALLAWLYQKYQLITDINQFYETLAWSIAVPIAALVASALMAIHDFAMTSLRKYMLECENFNNSALFELNYHDPRRPTKIKRPDRKLHDTFLISVFFLTSMMPLVFAFNAGFRFLAWYGDGIRFIEYDRAGFALAMHFIITLLACACVMFCHHSRRRAFAQYYPRRDRTNRFFGIDRMGRLLFFWNRRRRVGEAGGKCRPPESPKTA